jgi:HPt (histidine-containing phosphotransfer) domain-containing protein
MTVLFDAQDLIFRMMEQEDLARAVAATFLEDAPRQFSALGQAAETGDVAAVQWASHALKGAAASVGSPAVRRLAARIEAYAEEGRLPAELLPELGAAIEAPQPLVASFVAS